MVAIITRTTYQTSVPEKRQSTDRSLWRWQPCRRLHPLTAAAICSRLYLPLRWSPMPPLVHQRKRIHTRSFLAKNLHVLHQWRRISEIRRKEASIIMRWAMEDFTGDGVSPLTMQYGIWFNAMHDRISFHAMHDGILFHAMHYRILLCAIMVGSHFTQYMIGYCFTQCMIGSNFTQCMMGYCFMQCIIGFRCVQFMIVIFPLGPSSA